MLLEAARGLKGATAENGVSRTIVHFRSIEQRSGLSTMHSGGKLTLLESEIDQALTTE